MSQFEAERDATTHTLKWMWLTLHLCKEDIGGYHLTKYCRNVSEAEWMQVWRDLACDINFQPIEDPPGDVVSFPLYFKNFLAFYENIANRAEDVGCLKDHTSFGRYGKHAKRLREVAKALEKLIEKAKARKEELQKGERSLENIERFAKELQSAFKIGEDYTQLWRTLCTSYADDLTFREDQDQETEYYGEMAERVIKSTELLQEKMHLLPKETQCQMQKLVCFNHERRVEGNGQYFWYREEFSGRAFDKVSQLVTGSLKLTKRKEKAVERNMNLSKQMEKVLQDNLSYVCPTSKVNFEDVLSGLQSVEKIIQEIEIRVNEPFDLIVNHMRPRVLEGQEAAGVPGNAEGVMFLIKVAITGLMHKFSSGGELPPTRDIAKNVEEACKKINERNPVFHEGLRDHLCSIEMAGKFTYLFHFAKLNLEDCNKFSRQHVVFQNSFPCAMPCALKVNQIYDICIDGFWGDFSSLCKVGGVKEEVRMLVDGGTTLAEIVSKVKKVNHAVLIEKAAKLADEVRNFWNNSTDEQRKSRPYKKDMSERYRALSVDDRSKSREMKSKDREHCGLDGCKGFHVGRIKLCDKFKGIASTFLRLHASGDFNANDLAVHFENLECLAAYFESRPDQVDWANKAIISLEEEIGVPTTGNFRIKIPVRRTSAPKPASFYSTMEDEVPESNNGERHMKGEHLKFYNYRTMNHLPGLVNQADSRVDMFQRPIEANSREGSSTSSSDSVSATLLAMSTPSAKLIEFLKGKGQGGTLVQKKTLNFLNQNIPKAPVKAMGEERPKIAFQHTTDHLVSLVMQKRLRDGDESSINAPPRTKWLKTTPPDTPKTKPSLDNGSVGAGHYFLEETRVLLRELPEWMRKIGATLERILERSETAATVNHPRELNEKMNKRVCQVEDKSIMTAVQGIAAAVEKHFTNLKKDVAMSEHKVVTEIGSSMEGFHKGNVEVSEKLQRIVSFKFESMELGMSDVVRRVTGLVQKIDKNATSEQVLVNSEILRSQLNHRMDKMEKEMKYHLQDLRRSTPKMTEEQQQTYEFGIDNGKGTPLTPTQVALDEPEIKSTKRPRETVSASDEKRSKVRERKGSSEPEEHRTTLIEEGSESGDSSGPGYVSVQEASSDSGENGEPQGEQGVDEENNILATSRTRILKCICGRLRSVALGLTTKEGFLFELQEGNLQVAVNSILNKQKLCDRLYESANMDLTALPKIPAKSFATLGCENPSTAILRGITTMFEKFTIKDGNIVNARRSTEVWWKKEVTDDREPGAVGGHQLRSMTHLMPRKQNYCSMLGKNDVTSTFHYWVREFDARREPTVRHTTQVALTALYDTGATLNFVSKSLMAQFVAANAVLSRQDLRPPQVITFGDGSQKKCYEQVELCFEVEIGVFTTGVFSVAGFINPEKGEEGLVIGKDFGNIERDGDFGTLVFMGLGVSVPLVIRGCLNIRLRPQGNASEHARGAKTWNRNVERASKDRVVTLLKKTVEVSVEIDTVYCYTSPGLEGQVDARVVVEYTVPSRGPPTWCLVIQKSTCFIEIYGVVDIEGALRSLGTQWRNWQGKENMRHKDSYLLTVFPEITLLGTYTKTTYNLGGTKVTHVHGSHGNCNFGKKTAYKRDYVKAFQTLCVLKEEEGGIPCTKGEGQGHWTSGFFGKRQTSKEIASIDQLAAYLKYRSYEIKGNQGSRQEEKFCTKQHQYP